MSDSADNTLNILIKLGVIGKEDAQAAKDLLGETKEAAAGMTQSMPAGWEGLDKYKAALKGAGESAEGLRGHMHELRGLMAGAGPEAQELGHLLHFAFNPEMLIGAAAAGGMELYFHWLEKCQDRTREMIEDLNKFNIFQRQIVADGGSIFETQLHIAEAVAETRAQMHSLTEEFKEFDERAKLFDLAQNDALATRIDQRNTETTILEDQIALLEQMGNLTPAQAEQDKLRLEHQKRLAEIQDKITKDTSDYNSAKSDRDEKLKMAGGPDAFSPDAIGAAQAAVDKAQGDFNQAKDLAGKGGADEIGRINQAIATNKELMQEHPLEWNKYAQANQELIGQRATLQREIGDASKNLQTFADAAKAAETRLADIKGLKEKFDGLDAALGLLHQKLNDDASAQPAAVAAENQRAAIESVTAALKKGATKESIFGGGIDALFELDNMKGQTGHSPQEYLTNGTPAEKAYIQNLQAQVLALQNLETAIGNNGNSVVSMINGLVSMVSSHSDAHAATLAWAQGVQAQANILAQQLTALQATGGT